MGRYRPPTPGSAPYITPEGAAALRAELHELWNTERPQVTATVHEAAKNGDRSENGDYIYGKRRLREIDRRVRYLHHRLAELKIVDRTPDNVNKVYFGAWVTLRNEDDELLVYRIVGADEIALSPENISIDAPLAKALLGKVQGQTVELCTHGVNHRYAIMHLRYSGSNNSPPGEDFTS